MGMLDGKVAVVTGGGTGIGRAVSLGLEFPEQGRDRVGGAEDAGVPEDQRRRPSRRRLAFAAREDERPRQQQDGRGRGPSHASAALVVRR